MAINRKEMLRELKDNGKVKCPLCNKGYFIANPAIPIDKQRQFFCTNCKEEWYLNYRMS